MEGKAMPSPLLLAGAFLKNSSGMHKSAPVANA